MKPLLIPLSTHAVAKLATNSCASSLKKLVGDVSGLGLSQILSCGVKSPSVDKPTGALRKRINLGTGRPSSWFKFNLVLVEAGGGRGPATATSSPLDYL